MKTRCVEAKEAGMVLVNKSFIKDLTTELHKGILENWWKYISKLKVLLNVPVNCKQQVILQIKDKDPDIEATKEQSTRDTHQPSDKQDQENQTAEKKKPTPSGSSPGHKATLKELCSNKKERDKKVELMCKLFGNMDTSENVGQRCANRACIPWSLLEMAIEQTRGLQQIANLAIDQAHAGKLQFKESYSKQRQMHEDGEAAATKKFEAKVKTLKDQVQQEREKVKRIECYQGFTEATRDLKKMQIATMKNLIEKLNRENVEIIKRMKQMKLQQIADSRDMQQNSNRLRDLMITAC